MRGGIVTAVPDVHQPPFRRAVLAVNGGPSDARIVRIACQAARAAKAELVAVHVVEIDWSLPLEADIASRSEDAQRVLDAVEGIAESEHQGVETVLLQARDVGAALVDEASERGADLLILGLPLPQALRWRLRDRADHTLCVLERTLRGLGGPGTDQ